MTERKNQSTIPENLDLDADPGYSMDRLIGLADGIFAFAMTLLAINVNIGQLAADSSPEVVTSAVLGLAPQIVIFITSFLLVATYWQVNRRLFHYIKRSDARLTWLLILQLMFVAFLPVASGLFDTHPDVQLVLLLYAGTLTAIGVLGQALFTHARRAGLIAADANPVQLDYFSFRGSFTILTYVVVMLTGLVETRVARFVLLGFLMLYPFLKYIFKYWYQIRHRANPS